MLDFLCYPHIDGKDNCRIYSEFDFLNTSNNNSNNNNNDNNNNNHNNNNNKIYSIMRS